MKIKICGITNLEDALLAIECGADLLGFNFYQRSPRYIGTGEAEQIIEKLPSSTIKVGVFVNTPVEEVLEISSRARIDTIQLHGDEDARYGCDLRNATHLRIIKAVRITPGVGPENLLDFPADEFLLDSHSAGFGGSGEVFDWSVALEFKKIRPDLYLAGGLTPENVAEAVRRIMPAALDVCSGVEESKRKKDSRKMTAFIQSARTAI